MWFAKCVTNSSISCKLVLLSNKAQLVHLHNLWSGIAWGLLFLERISLIWRWVLFLRLYGYGASGSFKIGTLWITLLQLGNSYTCIEVNAHSLIITIIRKLRSGAHKHFLPWLYNSQPCEKVFRTARSMTSTHSTVVNFSQLELQYRVRRIDVQNEISATLNSDLKFPRSSRSSKTETQSMCI